MDWNTDITQSPYGKLLEVINDQMEHPINAYRGYAPNGIVNPDSTLFTTAYTPCPYNFFPTPAGRLCCPTKWRLKP